MFLTFKLSRECLRFLALPKTFGKWTHLNSSSSPATPQPPAGHLTSPYSVNASTALRGAQNPLSHLVLLIPLDSPHLSLHSVHFHSCKAFLQHLSGSCPFSIPLEMMFRIIWHPIWRGPRLPGWFLHLQAFSILFSYINLPSMQRAFVPLTKHREQARG